MFAVHSVQYFGSSHSALLGDLRTYIVYDALPEFAYLSGYLYTRTRNLACLCVCVRYLELFHYLSLVMINTERNSYYLATSLN